MKKLNVLLCICLLVAMVSCKETTKGTDSVGKTEMQDEQKVDQNDMAMAAEYQCPMDCEKGKTYDKDGKCPVCKMDLKKVEKEVEETHDDDSNYDSDQNHN